MASVVLNGVTYTDDANASTGMAAGGHRTRFVPCLADFVTEAATQLALQHASRDAADASEAAALASELAAAASALSALNSPGTNATSVTSITFGTGSKTLTIQTGKALVVGQFVSIAYTTDANNWMRGVITAYNAGTGSMTVNVTSFYGAGTFAAWSISHTSPDALPVQTGHSGKLLTTNGTESSWVQAIPLQSGNNGKVLQTDGSNLSWESILKVQKLGIFSASAATATPISRMDSIDTGPYLTTLPSSAIMHLAASATLFCAVQNSNGVSAIASTSPDGIIWTSRALTTSAAWTIASDGTGFLAVDTGGTVVNYSASGVTFSAVTSLPGSRSTSTNLVSRASGEYITRGTASTTTLYHTTNSGSTWTTQTAPVASMNTIFVIAGLYFGSPGGGTYYTSTTGLTGSWTSRALPGTCNSTLANPSGGLVAVNSSNLYEQYVSSDGINWTLVSGVFYDSLAIGATRISGSWSGTANILTTNHNGVSAFRSSVLANLSSYGLSLLKKNAKVGNIIVTNNSDANYTAVSVIDLANSTTAYFEA